MNENALRLCSKPSSLPSCLRLKSIYIMMDVIIKYYICQSKSAKRKNNATITCEAASCLIRALKKKKKKNRALNIYFM